MYKQFKRALNVFNAIWGENIDNSTKLKFLTPKQHNTRVLINGFKIN